MAKKTKRVKKIKVVRKSKKTVRKTKKSYKKPIEMTTTTTTIPVKVSKFLGYCKCGAVICKYDLKSKKICICPHCNKQQKVKQLKKISKNAVEKPKSQREYLERHINAEVIDQVSHAHDDVPQEILKKFEGIDD